MAVIIIGFACCFCLFILALPFLLGIVLYIFSFLGIGKLLTSLYYSQTYTEGFYLFWVYFYDTTIWVISSVLKAVKYCFVFFVINILPYIIVISICCVGLFHLAERLKKLKIQQKQMREEKKNPSLNFYVENLKIMRTTLLYIFGFLLMLRFTTWMFFDNSLLMEIIAYINIAYLMSVLMVKGAILQNHRNMLIYNFFLIFVSSYIIDDTFHMLTGHNFLFL